MNAVRVPWSHASFLVYLGGITILAAMLAFLSVESGQNGAAGLVGWSALVLGVLATLAFLARRNRRFVTAGLYALSAVAAFVVFFGALLDWFGWLPDTHGGLFAGFRFWLLVTDLLSGGGDWSAAVTIAFGVVLLGVAVSVDGGQSRIYGFWLHVVAGLTIGGGLLWFFHHGDFDWILIGVAALLYIALGDRLVRSSWVVLAAWGLLQVTTHFAERWAEVHFLAFFPLGVIFFPFLEFTNVRAESSAHVGGAARLRGAGSRFHRHRSAAREAAP